jgi:hypothetical protein
MIQHSGEMYVNRHIWPANWSFGKVKLWKFYLLGRVGFLPEVASAVELALKSAQQSAVHVGWAEVQLLLCIAILPRKASGHVGLTKHSRVLFDHSLYLLMLRKLHTLYLLFSDLSARFFDQILDFLYYSAQTPSFGHFSHIQGQEHLTLF